MKRTKKMTKISTDAARSGCAVSVSAMAQSSGCDSSSGPFHNLSWHVAPSVGAPVDVLTGFLGDDSNALGRPVGAAFDRQSALLVAGDVGNAIWRMSVRR